MSAARYVSVLLRGLRVSNPALRWVPVPSGLALGNPSFLALRAGIGYRHVAYVRLTLLGRSGCFYVRALLRFVRFVASVGRSSGLGCGQRGSEATATGPPTGGVFPMATSACVVHASFPFAVFSRCSGCLSPVLCVRPVRLVAVPTSSIP